MQGILSAPADTWLCLPLRPQEHVQVERDPAPHAGIGFGVCPRGVCPREQGALPCSLQNGGHGPFYARRDCVFLCRQTNASSDSHRFAVSRDADPRAVTAAFRAGPPRPHLQERRHQPEHGGQVGCLRHPFTRVHAMYISVLTNGLHFYAAASSRLSPNRSPTRASLMLSAPPPRCLRVLGVRGVRAEFCFGVGFVQAGTFA